MHQFQGHVLIIKLHVISPYQKQTFYVLTFYVKLNASLAVVTDNMLLTLCKSFLIDRKTLKSTPVTMKAKGNYIRNSSTKFINEYQRNSGTNFLMITNQNCFYQHFK